MTPANPSIVVGGTQRFIATGTFSDNSSEQLSSVTWSSSNTAAATVGNGTSTAGTANGVSAGTTTITASAGSISSSTTLNVTAPPSVVTSNLTNPRFAHTATLLENGTVLVAGGDNSVSTAADALAAAEIYNPAAQTFALTGAMTTARYSHTATLLANGLVLIAGGASNSGPLASAELYNPATGAFTPTGSMTTTRQNHTATLLNNGMVLIVSGNDSAFFSSAELYNPSTGAFTATGSLHTPRQLQTATLLNNGLVLIAGGDNGGAALAGAELYNPATGTFTLTGSMSAARVLHTATLLNDGRVLIAGGQDSNGDVLDSAELYDPLTGTFTPTNNMTVPREFHTATLLNNGTVLMAGGKSNLAAEDVLANSEIYDPVAGIFIASGDLSTGRFYHTATLLNNGTVLLAAGETYEIADNSLAALASAELYTPATLTPAGLVSIAVTPANPSIAVGATQQLTATGTFSDNSTEQLASVTWSSSNPAVAAIDNDAGDAGTAFGLAQGTATITAQAGSVSGSVTLTVGAAEVESITATSGTPQSATVNTAFAAPLVADVTQGGSPVSGVLVTFAAPSSGASGTFEGGVNTATTDDDGVATSAIFTANATAGSYTVTASAAGVSAKASFSLTNTAVVPNSTKFSFSLSGLEAANKGPHFYALAGSVAIDASGKVLAGEQDYNDASGLTSPQPSGDTITGGSLSVNATTGQGTLTLITNNANLGTSGTETLGVQFVNVNHALILQFDGTATSSGSMDLQTLPSKLSGGFAFTLSGEDSDQFAVEYGGVFSISGSNIENGSYDEQDDGDAPKLATAFSGTISTPDGFGRGSIAGTGLGGSPIAINYYIVGPEAIRIIDVDASDTGLGSAFGQGTGTFSAASLGSSVFAVEGNPDGSVFALAGMFATVPAGPAFQGVIDYDNESGNLIRGLPVSGTYSIASNGYGSLTIPELNDEPCTLGIYLTDPNLNLNDPNNTASGLGGALVVSLDQFIGSAGSGVLIPQTDTAAVSFAGNYAFGAQDYNDLNDSANGWEFDFVGQGSVTGETLSGTGLLSDPFSTLQVLTGSSATYSEAGFSGTPLADPNHAGRYTMSSNNPTPNPLIITLPTDPNSRFDFNVTIYQANGGQLFWIGEDSFGTFLGPLEQQGSLSEPAAARRVTTKTESQRHR